MFSLRVKRGSLGEVSVSSLGKEIPPELNLNLTFKQLNEFLKDLKAKVIEEKSPKKLPITYTVSLN